MKKRYWMLICLAITLLILSILAACMAACMAACSAPLASETATPEPTPTIDRLAAPALPENPTQADLGAHVYYQVCMACHGDNGQGLTEEWRAVWKEDSNCWQPECHGPDHPSHGFAIPKTCCPAVFGPGTLTRFDNALELFTYNADLMPWWNPGYLTREQFWQVTAFMMRTHGVMPNQANLDEGNAFAFNLRPASPLAGDTQQEVWLLSGILALAAGLLIFQKRLSR